MTLYRDDPKLGLKVITTVTGKKEYRRNCRLIQEKYYLMDEDCFFVEGLWYRIETGLIDFDHAKKEWVLKSKSNLVHGIVGFKDGEVVRGSFSPDIYSNCRVGHATLGNLPAMNAEMLQAAGYFEDIATCKWYDRKRVDSSQYRKMISIRNEVNHHNKGYNIEDNAMEFERKKESYKEYPHKVSKEVRKYAKYLGKLTFGAEIETSEGNLPESTQYKGGVVICRDGSIASAEYVTVPMAGPKGVQNIVDLSKELCTRTNIDMGCSLHYHVGNIAKDRLHLIALYVLGYKIQDEIFRMFPYYKTDHRGIKKKNYCQKLKQMSIHPLKDFSKEGYETYIGEVYDRIFMFLSDGHPPSSSNNRQIQRHPIAQKFNRPSRYYWLNLQNMIFSERGTAEFRLHTATVNSVKMCAWLFICTAIVKFAEANVERILSEQGAIPLMDVLNYYRDENPDDKDAAFLSEYLRAYYDSRCAQFARDLEKGDKISEHDITLDKKFTFAHKGVTLF